MHLLTALLATNFALAGDAGEAQLLPAGDFAARDGRPGKGLAWHVDDAAGERLAAALSATAAATPVVIDYDHQTLHVNRHGAKAPAAGWMLSAEWRAGQGLFAKVDWTPAAKKHIAEREYRFISPVLHYDRDTGRIENVALAALVNYPALTGMQAAALAAQFDLSPQETRDMAFPASLIKALGLAALATEAEVLAAIDALKTTKPAPLTAALAGALEIDAGADEAAVLAAVAALKTPKANDAALASVTALQGQVAALTARLNDDALAKLIAEGEAAGKITPATKPMLLEMGKKDLAALSAFVAALPVIPGLAGQSGGKDPGAAAPAETAALAADLQRAFGLSAEQFARGARAAA